MLSNEELAACVIACLYGIAALCIIRYARGLKIDAEYRQLCRELS